MPTVEWLTAEDVAVELRLTTGKGTPNVRHVQHMAARGQLPGTKVGRVWRFRRDHLDAYLERNTVMDSYTRAAIATAARQRGKA